MSLAPGRDLSHYRLVERIGEGGMGVVWKATDTTLGRAVAIKVLPEAFARDPERMARFEREARLLASLNHPHIASIYGAGSADGVRFLAMELVEGDDLAVRLARGPMPVAEAVELARQIAEALEAAHEKGIIHRDLKPANVKLTSGEQVKVLDFGLAKALEGEPAAASALGMSHSPTITSPMTAANVILGTAAYMSPEQARGKSVDRRADIWAFGCVLYECLTGRRAFRGETVSDTIAKILEREPDLSALPSATPPRVRELLQRCFAKDPRLRLRDIGDARIVLDEVLAARSPSGRLSITDTVSEGAIRRRVSRRMLALLVAFGAVSAVSLWIAFGSTITGGGGERTRCVSLLMPADLVVLSGEIARDGRAFVIAARPRSEHGTETPASRVYVRQLDSYEFNPLPGTEGAPWAGSLLDNRTLVFTTPVTPGASQYRYFRIPMDGSAPPITIADWKESWRGGCEMVNGDQLMMDGPASFIRLPKAGGGPSPSTRMDAGRQGVRGFVLSDALPGNRGVLTTLSLNDNNGWHQSVGILDPKSGRVRVVVEDGANPVYSPTGHLLFARRDIVLAVRFDLGRLETRGPTVAVWRGLATPSSVDAGRFSVTRDGSLCYRPGGGEGTLGLAFLDPAGHVEAWSSERREFFGELVLAPDGHQFACSILSARGIDEIWLSDVNHPGFRRLGTDPNADCDWPQWSPDNKLIAYKRTAKDDHDGVYVQGVEGGEARRILKPESRTVEYAPSSWLPDGSSLLLTRGEAGHLSLNILSLTSEEADSSRLRPLLSSRFGEWGPRVSPNGRFLTFMSDELGRTEVFGAEFHADGSTGPPVQVTIEGGEGARWSADGKNLYYDDPNGKLMRASVTRTPALSVSPPARLFDLETLGIAMHCALPDGRFLVALKSKGEGEITRYDLVLNWTQELERKMRAAR